MELPPGESGSRWSPWSSFVAFVQSTTADSGQRFASQPQGGLVLDSRGGSDRILKACSRDPTAPALVLTQKIAKFFTKIRRPTEVDQRPPSGSANRLAACRLAIRRLGVVLSRCRATPGRFERLASFAARYRLSATAAGRLSHIGFDHEMPTVRQTRHFSYN